MSFEFVPAWSCFDQSESYLVVGETSSRALDSEPVEVRDTFIQPKQECAQDAECDTVTSVWCSYNVRLCVAMSALESSVRRTLFPETEFKHKLTIHSLVKLRPKTGLQILTRILLLKRMTKMRCESAMVQVCALWMFLVSPLLLLGGAALLPPSLEGATFPSPSLEWCCLPSSFCWYCVLVLPSVLAFGCWCIHTSSILVLGSGVSPPYLYVYIHVYIKLYLCMSCVVRTLFGTHRSFVKNRSWMHPKVDRGSEWPEGASAPWAP